MTSLYAKYIKERQDLDIIEREHGFLSYRIEDNHLFIADLFVEKEHRGNGLVQDMVNEVENIASEFNRKYLMATVCPNTNNADISIKVVGSFGGKFLEIKDNMLYFIKEIK